MLVNVVKPEEAELVMISKSEYNGYQNALRIIRYRALQQVDKSQTDEHGYRLLRADQDNYRGMSIKIWRIVKTTPYSSKIALENVKSMVVEDINKYYHGILNQNLDTESMLWDVQLFNDKKTVIRPELEKRYEIFKAYNGTFVFDIVRYSINYATGVYEITYLASDLI